MTTDDPIYRSLQEHLDKQAVGFPSVKSGAGTKLLLAVLVLIVLPGCFRGPKPFDVMEDTVRIRPGSLAVISGENSEVTMRLADSLTRALNERRIFNALSQQEIARRAGKYPVPIKQADASNDLLRGAHYSLHL